MKVLQLNLPIKILDHAHINPSIEATTNHELVELMLRAKGSDVTSSIIDKMAKRITMQYGVESRFLSSKPFKNFYDSKTNSETLAKLCLSKMDSTNFKIVECILFGTTTPVRYTGSQAAAISPVTENFPACYDLKAGCSTSLATFHNAALMLKAGVSCVLAITSETLSKVIHPSNPETWFGLADGAASFILQANVEADFIIEHSYFSVDGNYVNAYTVPGHLPPATSGEIVQSYYMEGDGQLMEQVAFSKYCEMFELLKSKNLLDKIQYFIPHQVNRGLINKVLEKYPLKAHIIWDAKDIGNIGGSSILYSLSHFLKDKNVTSNDHILMMSVGGGISSSFQVWKKK
jgi:3-oxoacyl-[acyl-carrier-protein] synthase-3